MVDLDKQQGYWDSVASVKVFSHPLKKEILQRFIKKNTAILDYGCGYGRSLLELKQLGYENLSGVDLSEEMIVRGLKKSPDMNLQKIDGEKLPFEDNLFDCCILFAVLTCVVTNEGQKEIIREIQRVLKPGGLLYLSDYPLQKNERNLERYEFYKEKFGSYGCFELPEACVVRHHDMEWIRELLSDFSIIDEQNIEVFTMNGNKADIFQIVAEK